MEPRFEQDLVRVGVANAGESALVHEKGPNLAASPLKGAGEALEGELRRQDVEAARLVHPGADFQSPREEVRPAMLCRGGQGAPARSRRQAKLRSPSFFSYERYQPAAAGQHRVHGEVVLVEAEDEEMRMAQHAFQRATHELEIVGLMRAGMHRRQRRPRTR